MISSIFSLISSTALVIGLIIGIILLITLILRGYKKYFHDEFLSMNNLNEIR